VTVEQSPEEHSQMRAVLRRLTFRLKPSGEGTHLVVTYRVGGNPSHNLDKLAPIMDQVIGEQVARLVHLAAGAAPK
jgi:ribosomal protein S6